MSKFSMPTLDVVVPPKVNEYEYNEAMVKVLDYDWGEPIITVHGVEEDFKESGWINEFNLDQVLSYAIAENASDIHITGSQEVSFTINGDIVKKPEFGFEIEDAVLTELVQQILSNQEHGYFVRDLDYDCSYKIKHGPFRGRRFRVNVGYTFNEHYLVLRTISDSIPRIEDTDIEQEMIDWLSLPSGMFLICGATGTGKSTTLSTLLRNVQLTEPRKIITIEKPIETIYPPDGIGIVVQREVGPDVQTFYNGLTSAMRQNPDIILIGEVRNREEVSELIRAAETGHLAVSTMHTNSVATTLNRIVSLFTADERARILSTLGDTLRGTANQILVKHKNKQGRFALREILTINEELKELIVKGDIKAVRQYQIDHKITMEHKLAQAVKDNKCTEREARRHTPYPNEFKQILKETLHGK